MVKHRDDGSSVRNWCSWIEGIGPGLAGDLFGVSQCIFSD